MAGRSTTLGTTTTVGSQTPVLAYFDGLCEPRNPGGYACGGWCIEPHPDYDAFAGRKVGGSFYLHGAGATNNVAEYRAAIEALEAIHDAGYHGEVRLHGDSQLVVRQFNQEWRCNKPELQELLTTLHSATTQFSSVTLVWVPRDQNVNADEQSRVAYRRATDSIRG